MEGGAEHSRSGLDQGLSGAEAIKDLLERARSAPVPVILLTDEELAGLGAGPGTPALAPLPWLSEQEEQDREIAATVAMRGLVARGIVMPLPGAPLSGAHGTLVAIHQDLRAALTMRQTATAVVMAEQQTSGKHRARLLYAGRGGVLAEDVSSDGMHGFTAMTAEAAAQELATFVAPLEKERAGSLGPARTVTLNEIARGAVSGLDRARSVTVVGRLVPGRSEEAQEERLTVYDLTDHVLLAEPAGPGEAEGALTLAPAGTSQVQERLARMIRPETPA